MKVSVAVVVLSTLCVSALGGVVLEDVERASDIIPDIEPLESPDEQQSRNEEEENKLLTYGYLAFSGQFPYHAEVRIKPKSLTYFHTCAGSLITLKYILTTAACLYPWVHEDNIEYAFVTLGSLFDDNPQGDQRINFTGNEIKTHPFYEYPNYELYNIATIRLDCPATPNKYVQPIRMPRISDFRTYEMMEGTATGAAFVGGLKYLRNQVMSNADCQQEILPAYIISAQHLCTNSYIGGVFCNREYGSSLTIEDENGRVLVGFTDHVFGCSSNYPTRHVRISYFRDWIQMNSDYVFELMKASIAVVVCFAALSFSVIVVLAQSQNRLSTDGYLAFPGQFPYHAELRIKPKNNNNVRTCGGILITQRFLLTTAACVRYEPNNIEYAYATLGSVVNGDTQWQQHINFTGNGMRYHLSSVGAMYGHYDIGTIGLERPATLNQYVQLIRLPRLSDTRTFAMMEGTAASGRGGDGLRYLRNQVMTNEDCHQAIQPLYNISDQHICTDTWKGGAFCLRNTGSALTVVDENGPLLVGVGNLIVHCDYNYPIRHMRVSYFLEWIQLYSDYKFEP
uniref:Peptidase S1 domain-containing protein n=1 Tax=Anopheles christyi TaxID=43041 RepID=A0A182KD71_9DIPT